MTAEQEIAFLRKQLEDERLSTHAMEFKAMDIDLANARRELTQLKLTIEKMAEVLERCLGDEFNVCDDSADQNVIDEITNQGREALTLARSLGK